MKKTPAEITAAVTEWSGLAIQADEAARKRLAEDAIAGHVLDAFALKPAMEAQAAATPWRKVVRIMGRGMTAAEALQQVREDATETLMDGSETTSTSALTNEVGRMEREALRGFLRQTRRLAG